MTDWFPLWLSLRVSAIATVLAVVFGVAGGHVQRSVVVFNVPGDQT